MRLISLIFLSLLLFSCRNSAGNDEKSKPDEPTPQPEISGNTRTYTSQEWHFSAEIPEGFDVYEGELPGEAPGINFYDRSIKKDPPFGIGNDASRAYITIIPEGHGVDGPGGPRKSFSDWNEDLSLQFNIDPENSFAYLLENGEPWAVSISFLSPPPSWNDDGSIFVFYEVDDFNSECFSSNTGEEIAIDECNPLDGDSMKFYGEVSREKREALNSILESLYFEDPNRERKEIEDLIKVVQPQENSTVSSPIEISGEARGNWFFEASAPVKLVTESGEELAQGSLDAIGDWMTEDWVPFKANLDFETKEKRGYLIFNRANASGKPEHDRILRIPVVFN